MINKKLCNIFKFVVFIIIGALSFLGCSEKKKPTEDVKMPKIEGMVYIPSGKAVIGTDPNEEKTPDSSAGFARTPYISETPKQSIEIKGFYLDIYEVTFRQFKKFLDATKHPLPAAWQKKINYKPLMNYPVTGITWKDAESFAKWAGKRLPTEMEWERAARGPEGIRYVFGNKFDSKKAGLEHKGMIPVNEIKNDRNAFGLIGMNGNVSEWTSSWYKPYKGNKEREDGFGEKYKVFKGGTWVLMGGHRIFPEYYFRCAFRGFSSPKEGLADVGFRCAKDII